VVILWLVRGSFSSQPADGPARPFNCNWGSVSSCYQVTSDRPLPRQADRACLLRQSPSETTLRVPTHPPDRRLPVAPLRYRRECSLHFATRRFAIPVRE
jgi:hypothetical protein